MANLNATGNVSEVSFRFSITDISKLNGKVLSPEYLIEGVPWKVIAQKFVWNAEPAGLAIYLDCPKPKSTTNWPNVVSATFNLLSFKSGCAARKHETGPIIYDLYKDFGNHEFILWNDLIDAKNGYVENDTINLQIQIRAESSKASVGKFETICKSCDDGYLSEFRLTVTNIKSLTDVKTPEFILRKLPYQLVLFKNSDFCGVCLIPQPSQSVRQATNFVTELEFKLESSNAAMNRCERVVGVIHPDNHNLYAPKLVPWDELLEPKNGFINDGSIVVEVKIKAEFLDFVSNTKLECKICKNIIRDQDISSLPCGHVFCSPCITKSIKMHKCTNVAHLVMNQPLGMDCVAFCYPNLISIKRGGPSEEHGGWHIANN